MNKRLLSIILTLCMIFSLMPAFGLSAAADDVTLYLEADMLWYEGAEEGVGDTEENPYIINSISELEYLAELVNSGTDSFDGKFIKLSDTYKNLDSNGKAASLTTSIGRYFVNPFNGSFDGNYKCISLNIDIEITDAMDQSFGLFGYSSDSITTIVQNAATKGKVSVNGTGNRVYVGGVIGAAYSKVYNCSSSCEVFGNIDGTNGVGGVAGIATKNAQITGCSFSGTVTGNNDTGGIVGILSGNPVQNCFSTGCLISLNGSRCAGGVVGSCDVNSKLINCYASGAVSSYAQFTGGLYGFCGGPITMINCYTTCDITVNKSDAANVGGFCGQNSGPSTITNCYSAAKVSCVEGTNHNVGVLFGINYGAILKNVYALIHDEEGSDNDINAGLNIFADGGINNESTNYHILDCAQMKAAGGIENGEGWTSLTVAEGTISSKKAALVDALNDYADSTEGQGYYCMAWEQSDDINQGYPTFEKFKPSASAFAFKVDIDAKQVSVTVSDGVSGIGSYTVEYYRNGVKVDEVKDPGTYTVKIKLEASGFYDASEEITDPSWTFTVEGEEEGGSSALSVFLGRLLEILPTFSALLPAFIVFLRYIDWII